MSIVLQRCGKGKEEGDGVFALEGGRMASEMETPGESGEGSRIGWRKEGQKQKLSQHSSASACFFEGSSTDCSPSSSR